MEASGEPTSQSRPQSVVIPVQQAVQDAREDGDVVVQFGLFGGSGYILGEAAGENTPPPQSQTHFQKANLKKNAFQSFKKKQNQSFFFFFFKCVSLPSEVVEDQVPSSQFSPQTAGDAHKQDADPQTSHCGAAAHSIAHS